MYKTYTKYQKEMILVQNELIQKEIEAKVKEDEYYKEKQIYQKL